MKIKKKLENITTIISLILIRQHFYENFKRYIKKNIFFRKIYYIYLERYAAPRVLPKWQFYLGKDYYKKTFGAALPIYKCQNVLMCTGTGGHLPSATLESYLGIALNLRGARVDFFFCDGILPSCMMHEIDLNSDIDKFASTSPTERCKSCFFPFSEMLDRAGLQKILISKMLNDSEKERSRYLAEKTPLSDIKSFSVNGVQIGEHAMAGTLRFFAVGELANRPGSEIILRKFLYASLLAYFACNRVLASGNYGVIVVNHGIYVPQGIFVEVAKKLGIRVVTWHSAYRDQCFIFNHKETYHHGLISEPTTIWESMTWSRKHRSKIETYLKSRWTGDKDWIKFNDENPIFDVAAIQNQIGINFDKPTIGLLTNVIWDAQLHYKTNVFDNMMDWLIKTIKYFKKRNDIQLLIRIHPAELRGTLPSKQPVLSEIYKVFPSLPDNVFIITPESRISTYTAMSQCDSVLIYGTKTGVELAASGIPVIVAGEAWVRGKSITQDAKSETHYFQLLDCLPAGRRLNYETKERALKYAYHFFFRRMIPIDNIKKRKGWPPFQVTLKNLDELSPGASRGLDVICNGILFEKPFVYPDEIFS